MNLRSDTQQNIQTELNFSTTSAGEVRDAEREVTESLSTMKDPKSPASTSRLMEEVCERENLKEALRRVEGHKDKGGVCRVDVWGKNSQLQHHLPPHRQHHRR